CHSGRRACRSLASPAVRSSPARGRERRRSRLETRRRQRSRLAAHSPGGMSHHVLRGEQVARKNGSHTFPGTTTTGLRGEPQPRRRLSWARGYASIGARAADRQSPSVFPPYPRPIVIDEELLTNGSQPRAVLNTKVIPRSSREQFRLDWYRTARYHSRRRADRLARRAEARRRLREPSLRP